MNFKSFLKDFNKRLSKLKLDVEYQYNPLDYAIGPASEYLNRYAKKSEVFLLGMNPGPFGMAQTGVPFGDIGFVRDWLKIEQRDVSKPKVEHPKRLITGFDCPRGEVSGKRLWGWAKKRYVEPDLFFEKYFVWNYCPLCFMYDTGKNLTPNKLSKFDREELFKVCNWALEQMINQIEPSMLIGIGKFAEDRLNALGLDLKVAKILHPSPASPAANRGWVEQIEVQLEALDVLL